MHLGLCTLRVAISADLAQYGCDWYNCWWYPSRIRIAYAGIYGQKGPLYGYTRSTSWTGGNYDYTAHWDTDATKWYINCRQCDNWANYCILADFAFAYKIGTGASTTVGNAAAQWTDETCTNLQYFGCASYPGERAHAR
jgi:hypothetical protein